MRNNGFGSELSQPQPAPESKAELDVQNMLLWLLDHPLDGAARVYVHGSCDNPGFSHQEFDLPGGTGLPSGLFDLPVDTPVCVVVRCNEPRRGIGPRDHLDIGLYALNERGPVALGSNRQARLLAGFYEETPGIDSRRTMRGYVLTDDGAPTEYVRVADPSIQLARQVVVDSVEDLVTRLEASPDRPVTTVEAQFKGWFAAHTDLSR